MKKIFTLSICFFTYQCFAQVELDLSKKITINQSVNPEKITSIILTNALPGSNGYSINILLKHHTPQVLTIPTTGAPIDATRDVETLCQKIVTLTNTLDDETDESRIPNDVSNLQTAIKELSASNRTTCAPYINQANDEINSTKISIPVDISIGKNDELNITITRDNNTWSYSYKNEQPNHWITFYGFTYIPDFLTKFPDYYANQQTGGSYIISEMNGSNKNVLQNVSPTAMFTYIFFDKHPDRVIKFGLTGGIFYNTEILGAMIGPSLVIGNNVSLNTGISFVQKYKLKGQYKDGQTIQNTLDFNQLHDKIWSYDMFISIGFNLPELFTKKNPTSTTSTN